MGNLCKAVCLISCHLFGFHCNFTQGINPGSKNAHYLDEWRLNLFGQKRNQDEQNKTVV